jgi:5-hydroxyisourate hydrolase
MTHLTTHVLDAATGTPARGVALELTDGSGLVATGVTDGDGRAALGPDRLAAGVYTLVFRTGDYFAARAVETFHPFVSVSFTVVDPAPGETSAPHLHVPLLLSPFAYSTYRGS